MFLLHGDENPVETRTKSHTITSKNTEGNVHFPRPLCQSPIISSHQLSHALSDVHRLDLLGLEAEVTGPDSRGLSGQQPVGTLSHAGALPVEPLLTGGLTQNGILVIVHLTSTGTTWIHQAWRRLGP